MCAPGYFEHWIRVRISVRIKMVGYSIRIPRILVPDEIRLSTIKAVMPTSLILL